ncbi:DoxX family protein [Nocardia donostiensis]|uniref:DoxX family protein n=1 Tax=Nocardia donostiensis TaxID=1538463 RepID=A0A1W0AX90_9NOCA|nr:DoxX family protein [Nocardia donostiensis]OQS14903.1 DoxX family protein [Nocardia donostiensis]OQS18234.1 DoxX family protein [Nocardia donostiensis]
MGAVSVKTPEREAEETRPEPEIPRWHPLTRVALRFAIVYFGLFCLMLGQTIMVFLGIAHQWLPDQVMMWPLETVEPALEWVGREVFGVEAVLRESGSGDQAVIWVMVFCALIVAAAVTVVWSVLDRRRQAYPKLGAWFFTVIRLLLAGQMLFYGIAKAIPTQMPPPSLTALLQPYGEMSPASVLWLQVGSSPVYEILLGCAELFGGLLLLLPRTATLGAMLSLVSMAQVFVLNMTFDVPVKLLSFHLLLLSLVLLAPQARRMADMFLLQRRADPAVQPRLFDSHRARRIGGAVQAVLAVWLVAGIVHVGWESWNMYGSGVAKPPLYGIWEVSEFRADGQPVPPLLTDETRWQRVVFENQGMLTYQRMNGDLVPAPAQVDPAAHTITVTAAPAGPDSGAAPAETAPLATFTFDQPAPDRLHLDGELNGTPTSIELERVDENSFPLRSRGFHWIQEYPYFR